jgi:hypothetical protein
MEGVIDRIEGDKAVILVKGGGEMYLPVGSLPAGVREGSVLKFGITVDSEAEKERKRKVQDLQKRLRGKTGL